MDAFGNFLQVALTVLTLASLAGLGLMRGTVTNLRENLKDARDEIGDKDRRLSTAEAEIVRLNAKILAQAQGIDALGQQIRGEGYWIQLGNELAAHHRSAEQHWENDESLLADLANRIQALHETTMGNKPDERT